MTVPQGWRKSRRSSANTNCVEVANTLGAVRDSKNPDRSLTVDLRGFLYAMKIGRIG
jgi:hypothetical protein